jgi:hypothetical protein
MAITLEETEETLAYDHVLCVLDRSGDTKIMWSKSSDPEVENARKTFDDLRKKGYVAYRTAKEGDRGEVMRTFDATAERMILVPPMAGG